MYEKIVEFLATIERMKLQLIIRVGEIDQSDSEHSLSHKQFITHDDLIVHTNSIKTGAPPLLQSGSHEELEAVA